MNTPTRLSHPSKSPAPNSADRASADGERADVPAETAIERETSHAIERAGDGSIIGAKDSAEAADLLGPAMAVKLSAAQRQALENMAAGMSLTESAKAAGINRVTLYRWLHSDANFQAAHNAWQADSLALSRSRLTAMTDSALDAVQRAVDAGDGKLALALLKEMGTLAPKPPGSTDPEHIERERNMEREHAEHRLFEEEVLVKLHGTPDRFREEK
jgi:DNA-binding phage protein